MARAVWNAPAPAASTCCSTPCCPRDGFSLLEALRREGSQTTVLFLTARDAVADRVRGLEAGADDYLVKPFAFSELLARVRSLLRRGPAARRAARGRSRS